MLEASKLTIGDKTYDMNYLGKKKKTNLRRKLIVEYIQSKPAGEIIRVSEFQKVGHFSTAANAYAFVKRMIRDGVLMRYDGDRPKQHYYGVTGAIRVHKNNPEAAGAVGGMELDLTKVVKDMQRLGLKFTISISNENK